VATDPESVVPIVAAKPAVATGASFTAVTSICSASAGRAPTPAYVIVTESGMRPLKCAGGTT
jgi:hypothetical protein